MRNILFISILFFYSFTTSYAQMAPGKYFFEFTDKRKTTFSIDRPDSFLSEKTIQRRIRNNIPIDSTDLPVAAAYIDSLYAHQWKIIYPLKWFNGVVIQLSDSLDTNVKTQFPFVKNVIKLSGHGLGNTKSHGVSESCPPTLQYGLAYTQISRIKGHCLHNSGFKGKGISIAVFDAGFNGADTILAFKEMRESNRLLTIKDFVADNLIKTMNSSHHGTQVLSLMTASLHDELIGTAPEANYLLLRTEDTESEYLIEEYNWAAAAEYCDSMGIEIINSSLGYSRFDDSAMNHLYTDLDGNTAPVSIAAGMAASKGILVVVSAGNEGNKSWRYITAPADAKNIITVGAVDSSGIRTTFSSIGPSADRRIKPEIVAQGSQVWVQYGNGISYQGSGTSFSAPIISGMAACLWQAFPEASNLKIKNAIFKSSHNYLFPDSLTGYGIPDFESAFYILFNSLNSSISQAPVVIYPNPFFNYFVVESKEANEILDIEIIDANAHILFHKKIDFFNSQSYIIRESENFLPGIYFVKIVAANFQYVIKLVKFKS